MNIDYICFFLFFFQKLELHAEKTSEYQFIMDKKENVVSPLVSSIFCKLVEVK